MGKRKNTPEGDEEGGTPHKVRRSSRISAASAGPVANSGSFAALGSPEKKDDSQDQLDNDETEEADQEPTESGPIADDDDDGDDDGFTIVTSTRTRKTPYCKLTSLSKPYFTNGMIIRLNCHQTNMKQGITKDDDNTTMTKNFGAVHSKNRRAIVLWRHNMTMVCLPLYSFGDKGLAVIRPSRLREFMEVRNANKRHPQFPVMGDNKTLWANFTREPLNKPSCIHLGEPIKVFYNQEMETLGRLADGSWDDLNKQLLFIINNHSK